MPKTFKRGDHVSWDLEAGRVRDRILHVHTEDVDYKGYVHHASPDDPQYEIKSDETDHVALHKGRALRLLRHRQQERAMAHPFFTIGHARRPIDEFIALLQAASVTFLADVRTVPRSRTNPQYNRETLPQALAAASIGYEHIASLGGLRSRKREVPRETNAFWQNDSFHNYADHALSESFRDGLAHLRELGQAQRCAIMCAETLWWRCHRRIITDYLLAAGERVFHILGPGKIEEAVMNSAAHVLPGGRLSYPAQDRQAASPDA